MTTKESLIAELNTSYEKTGRGFSLNHKHNFQQCADLNGLYARGYLMNLGFEVIDNGDNGRNGYAITSCGLYLSTNGYMHKLNLNVYDVWIGSNLIGRVEAETGAKAIEKVRRPDSPSPASAYDAIHIRRK